MLKILKRIGIGALAYILGRMVFLAIIGNRQELKISYKVNIDDNLILLESANSTREKNLGLKNRVLPPNRGMLLEFEKSYLINIWAKDLKIPIDIIYLDEGKVTKIEKNIDPCNGSKCPIYQGYGNQAIEINTGLIKNLKVGNILRIERY